MLNRSLIVAIVITSHAPQALAGDAPSVSAQSVSAEESRLRAGTFRAGLKRRGLNVILEQHLQDFPPRDEVERQLMTREIKLADFSDASRSREQRLTAIDQANAILVKLIEDKPYDARRFDWQFTLAHSLIYQEAEPFFSAILYHGGSSEDRSELVARSSRAVGVLESLADQLAEENKRIDALSIREFERLEKNGSVARMDSLAPKSRYLHLWARLYDALPRTDRDPRRAGNLRAILAELDRDPAILETDHADSHVQVQAWLLAGMSHRLLNEHDKARSHLGRALLIASSLNDADELARIQWAVTLARIERVRNELENQRFSKARDNLADFRSAIEQGDANRFPLQIVAALLDRGIARAQLAARGAPSGGEPASRSRPAAWWSLARLVERHPERRDEVFAVVAGLLDDQVDETQLDPFEQCSLLITRLGDAIASTPPDAALLEGAVHAGRRFLSEPNDGLGGLIAPVKYHLATAQYHLGRLPQAAAGFLDVASHHRQFEQALPAATYAVQLASEMYGDPSLSEHPQVRQLYLDALKTLVSDFSGSDPGRYWRFYLAQTLEELGQFDEAARHYELVTTDHEHYLDSLFLEVRTLARGLAQAAQAPEVDSVAIDARVDAFLNAQREFVTRISAPSTRPAAPASTSWKRYLARVKLLAAEVHVLPAVDRPARAITDLADFERDFPDETSLAGRVWRTRLLAYERLDRLDEATAAIPRYMAADPDNAITVLQQLLEGLRSDIQSMLSENGDAAVQKKADVALLVAEQIKEWSTQRASDLEEGRLHAINLQWAQANLLAGRFVRARDLYQAMMTSSDAMVAPQVPITDRDPAIQWGYAESLYHLGDHAEALPIFNALAVGLRTTEPLRWESLLRDLQCRTSLGHDPQAIVKVVDQQQFLFPELGGPAIAAKLLKLRRENQRRADRG